MSILDHVDWAYVHRTLLGALLPMTETPPPPDNDNTTTEEPTTTSDCGHRWSGPVSTCPACAQGVTDRG